MVGSGFPAGVIVGIPVRHRDVSVRHRQDFGASSPGFRCDTTGIGMTPTKNGQAVLEQALAVYRRERGPRVGVLAVAKEPPHADP